MRLALFAGALALAGCTVTTGGTATPDKAAPRAQSPTTPTATTPALVPTASLRDLLLKRSELGEIVGDTEMKEVESYSGHTPSFQGFEPPECAYRARVAATVAYANTARQGLQGDSNRGAAGHVAAQAVSVYDDRKAPLDVLLVARLDWFSCEEGTAITVSGPDTEVSHWSAGPTTVTPTRITTTIRRVEPPPRTCFHVLAAKANVVAEGFSCGEGDTAAQANAIVDKILAKVPE